MAGTLAPRPRAVGGTRGRGCSVTRGPRQTGAASVSASLGIRIHATT